jgi:hypothetical protein
MHFQEAKHLYLHLPILPFNNLKKQNQSGQPLEVMKFGHFGKSNIHFSLSNTTLHTHFTLMKPLKTRRISLSEMDLALLFIFIKLRTISSQDT